MIILEGFLVGLAMVIFVGPVFFTLLQSTLNKGFWPGWMVALGILVSDVVVVALCAFGAAPFLKAPTNQMWLGIIGAVILFALGLKYLIKPSLDTEGKKKGKGDGLFGHFVKGFLVNGVNPFVFVVWIGVIGVGQEKYGFDLDLLWYLGAALLGIIATDTLKVVFAHKIKRWIKPNILVWVFRVVGVVLIGFGIYTLIYILQNFVFNEPVSI